METMNNLYANDATVEQMTKYLVNKGVYIFQIWKKGYNGQKHCEWLLKLANFPPNASVLDIACGIGGVAKAATYWRSDLKFSLQNISQSQLNMCPSHLPQYQGNMDTLENVPSGQFDAAMVCYALGHVGDLDWFFHNTARVLKPGGQLFVYDVQALPGWEQWLLETLGYTTWTIKQLVESACVRKVFSSMQVIEEVRDADFLNCHEFLNVCPMINAVDVTIRTKPVGYKFFKAS